MDLYELGFICRNTEIFNQFTQNLNKHIRNSKKPWIGHQLKFPSCHLTLLPRVSLRKRHHYAIFNRASLRSPCSFIRLPVPDAVHIINAVSPQQRTPHRAAVNPPRRSGDIDKVRVWPKCNVTARRHLWKHLLHTVSDLTFHPPNPQRRIICDRCRTGGGQVGGTRWSGGWQERLPKAKVCLERDGVKKQAKGGGRKEVKRHNEQVRGRSY